ncbi:MAG: dihydroneopterin aldolase [Saprospiraceae bacterium]|nr:dihydroneopterin aldolase [Saprospiraceae bacterium]
MAVIALEGMQFYAYHGFYEEEQKIGNHFIVDVQVETRVNKAAQMDDLAGTINYETLYTITRMEMRKPSQLLEHVGQRIIDKVSSQYPKVKNVRIRISKMQPPLGGRVDRAFIEMEQGGGVISF